MHFNKPSKAKEPDNIEKAYEYAVFLLSLRLRTMGEMRSKMERRGYRAAVIDATVERLRSQKYLDDERYAEIFLENLKAYRHFGFYGVKKKLMEKKLPGDLVERLLAEHFTAADELAVGKRLLKKEGWREKSDRESMDDEIYYHSFGDSDESKDKQKKAQRLRARGFRSEVISRLV